MRHHMNESILYTLFSCIYVSDWRQSVEVITPKLDSAYVFWEGEYIKVMRMETADSRIL